MTAMSSTLPISTIGEQSTPLFQLTEPFQLGNNGRQSFTSAWPVRPTALGGFLEKGERDGMLIR